MVYGSPLEMRYLSALRFHKSRSPPFVVPSLGSVTRPILLMGFFGSVPKKYKKKVNVCTVGWGLQGLCERGVQQGQGEKGGSAGSV